MVTGKWGPQDFVFEYAQYVEIDGLVISRIVNFNKVAEPYKWVHFNGSRGRGQSFD